jgi:hypothetical protein
VTIIAMSDRTSWYRVFARSAASVPPAVVLADLVFDGAAVQGHFQADEHGWYRCELKTDREIGPIVVECFRVLEEGVRPEMQSWAAYLETLESPYSAEFMAAVNAAAQVFTMQLLDVRAAELLRQLCGNLAQAADGFYQVDGEGFFWSNGSLAVGESA